MGIVKYILRNLINLGPTHLSSLHLSTQNTEKDVKKPPITNIPIKEETAVPYEISETESENGDRFISEDASSELSEAAASEPNARETHDDDHHCDEFLNENWCEFGAVHRFVGVCEEKESELSQCGDLNCPMEGDVCTIPSCARVTEDKSASQLCPQNVFVCDVVCRDADCDRTDRLSCDPTGNQLGCCDLPSNFSDLFDERFEWMYEDRLCGSPFDWNED
jgi:hypothetical protein